MRALAGAIVAVLLMPCAVAAQDGPGSVTLRAVCEAALPADLADALELELVGDAAPVVVYVVTPCERAERELEIVIETSAGARLGPLHLEVGELGPRLRGRVAALWIAEHVRVARGELPPEPAARAVGVAPQPAIEQHGEPTSTLGAPISAPSTEPPATDSETSERPERARLLARGSFALSLAHDIVVGALGPGADLRLELGTRGRPGVALELGIGGSGLTRNVEDAWTELRATLGGLLDVMLDADWGAAFGVRLVFVHEVFTGTRMDAGSTSAYRIDDALDIRASAFAAGRLYVHEGLSVFAEVELGALLFSFVPSGYTGTREQNLVQGVLRVGVGID